jgi:hypothetical protein
VNRRSEKCPTSPSEEVADPLNPRTRQDQTHFVSIFDFIFNLSAKFSRTYSEDTCEGSLLTMFCRSGAKALRQSRCFSSSATRQADFTHAVIGGGAVGLAIARKLQQRDNVSTVLIEKHGMVGSETSSRNSEVRFVQPQSKFERHCSNT